MLKVFICHSKADFETALKIKEYFGYVGFSSFLAPQTIQPSEDFIYKIKWYLRKSRFIVPLISKNFLKSDFANQEIGYALAHEKDIIPISIDGEHPGGLIGNLQDASLTGTTSDEILSTVTTIYSLLIEVPEYWICREEAKEGLVEALCNSDNFSKTAAIIPLLIRTDAISKFAKDLLKKIHGASKTNDQIYKYFYFSKLKNFLITKGFDFN